MFAPEEILKLVLSVLEIEKAHKDKKSRTAYPEYTPVYPLSVELKDKICIHSTYGKFPHKLLNAKAPNQDPKEWEYQKSIYPQPPITMPYWYKAIGMINRIWNPQNWSIKWNDDKEFTEQFQNRFDELPEDYFNKQYPRFGSYEAYHKEIYLPKKINDPNAIACYKPYKVYVKEVEKDGEKELQIDDTILPEPIEYIYGADQIVSFEEGHHLLVLLNEKSIIKDGALNVKEGKVFEFYDTDFIYKIIQIGNKQEPKFSIQIYWQHGLGYLPCRKLKGRPEYIDNEIIYYSYFLPAVSLLDEAIRNFSTEQMSVYANAFPVRWQYVDRCDYQNCGIGCEIGHIKSYDDKKGEHVITICPKCKGTGKQTKISPTGVLELEAPKRLQEGDLEIPTPPLGWVSTGTEILEFLEKKYKSQIEQGFTILNIDISNSNAKGSDTALGKQIDREELFSFIKAIADEIFEAYSFGIKTIGLMRYGFKNEAGEPYFIEPMINFPKTFEIRDENELTIEIGEAKKNGMPDIAIRELLEEWLSIRFNSMDSVSEIVTLAFAVDRLITKASMEINAGISIGTIAKWEAILHDSIYNFIGDLIVKEEDFLSKDFEYQKNTLIGMAKKKSLEIAPVKNSTEDILGGIANANA